MLNSADVQEKVDFVVALASAQVASEGVLVSVVALMHREHYVVAKRKIAVMTVQSAVDHPRANFPRAGRGRLFRRSVALLVTLNFVLSTIVVLELLAEILHQSLAPAV